MRIETFRRALLLASLLLAASCASAVRDESRALEALSSPDARRRADALAFLLREPHDRRVELGLELFFSPDPFPQHLFLAPGSSDLSRMIRKTRCGVLISRFHYTNLLDPRTLTITGMTRDGTFLVRDGEIRAPLKNLRFQISIIKALSCVEEISERTALCRTSYSWNFVPALKLSSFTFIGSTP